MRMKHFFFNQNGRLKKAYFPKQVDPVQCCATLKELRSAFRKRGSSRQLNIGLFDES